MPTDPLLLIGAGGHGRVVLDALRAGKPSIGAQVMDDNLALDGTNLDGFGVKSPVDWKSAGSGFHVAIGANRVRSRCFDIARQHGQEPVTVIHPAAVVSPRAMIGPGSFLAAGAIVAPAARIGAGVIVNHGAVVDHDCIIGDFCHVAPQATLGGGVVIDQGTLIGAGAIILPGIKIGAHAVIGAGAVVTRDIAAGQTVAGVPARLHPVK